MARRESSGCAASVEATLVNSMHGMNMLNATCSACIDVTRDYMFNATCKTLLL